MQNLEPGVIDYMAQIRRALIRPVCDGEWLTVEELCTWLKLTSTEVYALTRNRRAARGLQPIPHRRVGRKLMFRRSEIETWLDSQPGRKPGRKP
jgi:excisionase family DNA binding protein